MFVRRKFWAIPLLCGPILILLLVKSAPSFVQLAKSLVKPYVKQASDDTPTAWPWQQQPASKSQVIPSPPTPNPYSPNTRDTPPPRLNAKEKPSRQAAPDLEMRIAIAIKVKNLVLATSTPGVIKDERGRVIKTLASGMGYSTQPKVDKIDFGSWQSPASIWIEATQGGYIFLGKNWYRGKLRLINQGGTLLAVNHVNLEHYLYSVVGSEMWSDWPLEALKAQAVAARSYALARYAEPANRLYHMGATQAWQVYKGLDGEASSTHAAVNQTAGQFLILNGGVVDAWYADTDQRVAQAHGGRGMSQHGAYKLAKEQGYDYLQILGFYYPGSSLTQLQMSGSPNLGGKNSS